MKAIQNDQQGVLEKYEFQCPFCGVTHKRGTWSIAHAGEWQLFNCSCGQQIDLPPLE
jgi:transcription elongation factor Elf1